MRVGSDTRRLDLLEKSASAIVLWACCGLLAHGTVLRCTLGLRDDERTVEGHIEGSVHIPSGSFPDSIEQLREAAKGKSKVVFHCALSQVRSWYPVSGRNPGAELDSIVQYRTLQCSRAQDSTVR